MDKRNENLSENVEVLRSHIIQNAFSIKYKRREDKMLREKYPFMKKDIDEVTPERVKKENAELKILKEIVLLFPQVEGLVNTKHWWKFYGEMKQGKRSISEIRNYTPQELETLVKCLDDHKDFLETKYPNMIDYMNSIRKEVRTLN
ncbi:hypothetical protein N9U90_05780 [Candidatus Pelagibacter sp.]|nr:hypothetical protein [Candidatus Pelagibacter sp.]